MTSKLTQVTLQSTFKSSVAPKYSHMGYQTLRLMTKPPQNKEYSPEDNFNYVNRSKTSKSPRTNPHNRSFTQRQNFQQQTSIFVNFNNNPRNPKDPSENYPFVQQNKSSK